MSDPTRRERLLMTEESLEVAMNTLAGLDGNQRQIEDWLIRVQGVYDDIVRTRRREDRR